MCTDEADVVPDCARVLAGVSLPRAGDRSLELLDQPGQAGLHGSRSSGRACPLSAARMPLLFAHAHIRDTGRARVPKPLSRAVTFPGFARAESRLCLWLGVSGMAADCSCSAW